MHLYLSRRILPFFIIMIISEMSIFGIVTTFKYGALDLSLISLIKSTYAAPLIGLHTFANTMLFYVIYLLILPQKYHQSKFDKLISVTAYGCFIFYSLRVIWFIWRKYHPLPITKAQTVFETASNNEKILMAYLISNVIILVLTILIVLFTRKKLFTTLPIPRFTILFYHTVGYIILCNLIFISLLPAVLNFKISKLSHKPTAEEKIFILQNQIFNSDIKNLREDIYNPNQNKTTSS